MRKCAKSVHVIVCAWEYDNYLSKPFPYPLFVWLIPWRCCSENPNIIDWMDGYPRSKRNIPAQGALTPATRRNDDDDRYVVGICRHIGYQPAAAAAGNSCKLRAARNGRNTCAQSHAPPTFPVRYTCTHEYTRVPFAASAYAVHTRCIRFVFHLDDTHVCIIHADSITSCTAQKQPFSARISTGTPQSNMYEQSSRVIVRPPSPCARFGQTNRMCVCMHVRVFLEPGAVCSRTWCSLFTTFRIVGVYECICVFNGI